MTGLGALTPESRTFSNTFNHSSPYQLWKPALQTNIPHRHYYRPQQLCHIQCSATLESNDIDIDTTPRHNAPEALVTLTQYRKRDFKFNQQEQNNAVQSLATQLRSNFDAIGNIADFITPKDALSLLWIAVRFQDNQDDLHVVAKDSLTAVFKRVQANQVIVSGQWLVSCLEALQKLKHVEGEDPTIALITSLLETKLTTLSVSNTLRLLSCLSLHPKPVPPRLLSLVATKLERPSFFAGLTPPQLSQLILDISSSSMALSTKAAGCLTDASLGIKQDLSSGAVGTLLWLLARRGQATDELIEDFAFEIVRKINKYTPAQLADVARACAKTNLAPTNLFAALAARAAQCIDTATPQDLLRIVSSYQQLDMEPVVLLEAVEVWADRRLASQSTSALSWAVWSFARMNNQSQRLLETAAECACRQATEFSQPDLARILWAFGSLHYTPGDVFLNHAVEELSNSAQLYDDKGVANILWALATLQYKVPNGALEKIAQLLMPNVAAFSPQAASTVIWSYATFHYRPSCLLLKKLATIVSSKSTPTDSQALSMTIWGLASLDIKNVELFETVSGHVCAGRLSQYEGQHLANIIWGAAKMGINLSGAKEEPEKEKEAMHTKCVLALAREAAHRANQLTSQEIFNVIWGLATLRAPVDENTLELLCYEAAERMCAFNSQELSNTLWALVRLECPRKIAIPVLRAVEKEFVTRKPSSFEARHLAIIVWSLGSFGYDLKRTASRDMLLDGLLQVVHTMNSTSVNCCFEGLLTWKDSNLPRVRYLIKALSTRTLAIAQKSTPVEFASLAAYLVLFNNIEGAKSLLLDTAIRIEGREVKKMTGVARTAPIPSLIMLLFAIIHTDGVGSSKELKTVLTRLKKVSRSYRIPETKLALLHVCLESEALRDVEGRSEVVEKFGDGAVNAFEKHQWMFSSLRPIPSN